MAPSEWNSHMVHFSRVPRTYPFLSALRSPVEMSFAAFSQSLPSKLCSPLFLCYWSPTCGRLQRLWTLNQMRRSIPLTTHLPLPSYLLVFNINSHWQARPPLVSKGPHTDLWVFPKYFMYFYPLSPTSHYIHSSLYFFFYQVFIKIVIPNIITYQCQKLC